MFKIITFLLLFTSMLYAGVENYLIGLNAYKDGFDSIAEENLQTYLKNAADEEKARFAKYILYKINLQNNNYGKAYEYLEQIEGINDKRFDLTQMKIDKMKILLNTDCSKASDYLINAIGGSIASLYLKSKCPVNDRIVSRISGSNISDKIKAAYTIKLADNPGLAYQIAKNTSFEQLDKNTIKYLGLLFYKNGRYDIFWKAYKYYKDDRFVNLALNRIFETGDYKGFLESFVYNEPKFKISGENYCRAVKSRIELGENFNCSWIDKCYPEKNKEYIQSKFACLLQNKSSKAKDFINNNFEKEKEFFCKQSGNIISEGYYNSETISGFRSCGNKYKLAELLLRKKRTDDVLNLLKNDNSDKSLYIKAKAYILAGDLEKAKQTAEKINEQKLKNSLFKNNN